MKLKVTLPLSVVNSAQVVGWNQPRFLLCRTRIPIASHVQIVEKMKPAMRALDADSRFCASTYHQSKRG